MNSNDTGRTNWRNVCVAASGLFVYTAANAYLSGGLGAFGRSIGLRETATGIILSLGALAAILMPPAFGYASERWGRKRLMFLALPLLIAGPLGMAMLFAWPLLYQSMLALPLLVLARGLQASGGSGLIPLAQAYVADTTTTSQRARGMGVVGAILSMGTIAGSALLWSVAAHSAAAGFGILALAGLLCLVFMYFRLPDPLRSPTKPGAGSVSPNLGRLWPFLGVTLLGFTAYSMIIPLISLRLIDTLGMQPGDAASTAGLLLSAFSAAAAVSQTSVALFGARRLRMILATSCAAGGLALGGIEFAGTVGNTCLAMALAGIALGQASPTVLAALSLAAPPEAQGKTAGLNAACRGAGMAIGPLLGVMIYQVNSSAPFIAATGLLLAAALLPVLQRRLAGA